MSHEFETTPSNGVSNHASVESSNEAGLHDSPAMHEFRLARTSRAVRRIGAALQVLFVAAVAGLAFIPWQQSVRGSGQVVAYAPAMRQQTVQAATSGRLVEWNAAIVEGAHVDKNEVIFEIQDLDPELLSRLRDQEQASLRKLETAKTKVNVYAAQMTAFDEAKAMGVSAADQLISAAEQKVRAEEQNLEAALAGEYQERLNYEQLRQAAAGGLASGLELQIAERKFKEALAKVEQARAYIDAAKSELASKRHERVQKEREAQTKIDSARAYMQDSVGEVATAEKELADIRVKVARQENQVVRAPQSGFILRLYVNPGSQVVKEGDALFTIVPETSDRAVEMWIDGNDAPLVTVGRHVRLQFEGWPAVQFAGWPSVAVGTFGGEVAAMDATDDGQGRFRILITPENSNDWPSERFLRQGVRANGWVLLNQVSLGYELWRNANGFPPTLSKPPSEKDAKAISKLKK